MPTVPPRNTFTLGSKAPTVLVVVAVVAALSLARDVLIPIALAALMTFLLAPLVHWLERWRVPRVAAVLVVVGLVAGGLGAVVWTLESQAMELVTKLPEYRTNIRSKLESVRPGASSPWAQAGRAIADIGEDIAKSTGGESVAGPSGEAVATPPPSGVVPVRVMEAPGSPLANVKAILGPVFTPLFTAGIVAVFTIFMLMKREDVRDRFIRLIGARSLNVTTQALDDAAERVNQYLVMQLATNVFSGVAVGIGLYAIGLPSPALWGMLVVVMRFVPFIGMWIAAALPLALSVAQTPGWTEPLLVLCLFGVVELIVANIVEPLLLGHSTGLSAIAILVSAVFWGWLWGGVGLILATPLTVCVAVIGRHVPHLEFFDILLGKESGLAAHARLYQRLLAGDVDEATKIVNERVKAGEGESNGKGVVTGAAPAEVFDTVVLPALCLAEEDRHNGNLDVSREHAVIETMRAVLEDVGSELAVDGKDAEAARVLCVPVWDVADELAATMFTQVLRHAGVSADELSAESLSGEIVAAVMERKPAVVCLSSVPPGAVAPARVLYRRLRAKMPADAHIVIALWDPAMDEATASLAFSTEGADRVVTTMSGAAAVVKALAAVGTKDMPGVGVADAVRIGAARVMRR